MNSAKEKMIEKIKGYDNKQLGKILVRINNNTDEESMILYDFILNELQERATEEEFLKIIEKLDSLLDY